MSELSRRSFLGILAGGSVLGLFDWLVPSPRRVQAAPRGSGGVTVFKRSGRGRHVSNAAKAHNANHLYATVQAALNDPAHRGDRSRVVPVMISATLFRSLFGDGRSSVDFRTDLRTPSDVRQLQHCLSGPGNRLSAECQAADHDGNGAVDLRDMAILQRNFTGE